MTGFQSQTGTISERKSLKAIMDALQNVYVDVMPINLRFKPSSDQWMQIDGAEVDSFWQFCGPKIENLLFEKGCRGMKSSLLCMILKHCTALKSFSYLGSFGPEYWKNHPWPAETMAQIKVNLQTLCALSISETTRLTQADPLWELVTHLNELDINSTHDSVDQGYDDSAKLESVLRAVSVDELSFRTALYDPQVARRVSTILQQDRFRLKGVDLSTRRNDVAVEFCQLLASRCDSIERLKLTCHEPSCRDPFSARQALTSISATVLSLQNLRQLSLYLDWDRAVSVDSVARLAYQALLRLPHLITLQLRCYSICETTISDDVFANMPILPADLPLQELKIKFFPFCSQIFRANSNTPTVLSNLKSLSLSEISELTDEMVRYICDTCKALESLTLDECGNETDGVLCGDRMADSTQPNQQASQQHQEDHGPADKRESSPPSSSYLADLHHLKELNLNGRFTGVLLRQLRFSDGHSLTKLSLHVLQCTDESLRCIAQAHPGLETFSLDKYSVMSDFDDVSLSGQLELVRRCTRLRSFNSSSLHADAQLRKQMKQLCPTLHYINGITLLS